VMQARNDVDEDKTCAQKSLHILQEKDTNLCAAAAAVKNQPVVIGGFSQQQQYD